MADAIVLTRPISSGVSSNTNLPGVLTANINGQPMVSLTDNTRFDKILSVAEQILPFGENQLDHLDWIRPVGNASDADSGYVADFDGTITTIAAHCEDTETNLKNIHVYVDGVDAGSLGVLQGGENATINTTTINIDFSQGQRIRLRAVDSTSGIIHDTVIKLTIKWRADPAVVGAMTTDLLGVSMTTINNQPMLTLADVNRSGKILSVAEQILPFGENQLGHLDWLRPVGSTSDADSGYIADFDGTITTISAHCEDTELSGKDIHVYVDGVDAGSLGALQGGENAILRAATNIDFSQGQRIRLRAVDSATGDIHDTVVKLTIKWRLNI